LRSPLEPPYSELESRFVRYVKFGFEYSYFEPYHPKRLNLSRNTSSDGSYIWADLPRSGLKPDTLYFVVLRATLKGPGVFGHFLGGANYELEVREIEKAVEVDRQDCERHLEEDA
jgi:hypothetical protein